MTTFSPALVQDFDRFRTLFSTESALKEIYNAPKERTAEPKGGKLYYGFVDIVVITLTAPFRWIIALFLQFVFIPGLYTRCTLLSSNLMRIDWNVLTQLEYGRNLLMPTINRPLLKDSDVYMSSKIARRALATPLNDVIHNYFTSIDFGLLEKGVCHGMVQWFNYLLLKAIQNEDFVNRVSTFSELLRAVAIPFEYGAPKQADLLQIFYGAEKVLFPVVTKEYTMTSVEELITNLRAEEMGVYSLTIHGHEMSFIKYKDEEFVFDPNKGLVRLGKSEDLYYEINYYVKSNPQDPNLYFDRQCLAK